MYDIYVYLWGRSRLWQVRLEHVNARARALLEAAQDEDGSVRH